MRAMKGFALLSTGIIALAFVLGYMVSASATPVAAVTIPALFGIAVTAFGLVQSPWLSKDASEWLKTAGSNQAALPILETISRQLVSAPARIGAVLLCFSVGFMTGAYIGAKARLSSWLVSAPERFETTWYKHHLTEPPSAEAALYWIYLQGILTARGLEEEQLKSFYLLQAKDWNSRMAVGPVQPQPTPKPTTSGPAGDNVLRNLEEWVKKGPQGNPIANQPPPGKDGRGGV